MGGERCSTDGAFQRVDQGGDAAREQDSQAGSKQSRAFRPKLWRVFAFIRRKCLPGWEDIASLNNLRLGRSWMGGIGVWGGWRVERTANLGSLGPAQNDLSRVAVREPMHVTVGGLGVGEGRCDGVDDGGHRAEDIGRRRGCVRGGRLEGYGLVGCWPGNRSIGEMRR